MVSQTLQAQLKQLPESPGIYLFKDKAGTILYVGKAKSLRKRVLSYFQPSRPHPARLMQLVNAVTQMDWLLAGSEAEALLLEASHIKEYQPKYNVLLRDDKSYPYLRWTAEETYPRLFIGRGESESGVKEIGPFTHVGLLKQAFLAIRRVIPFRTCTTLPKRACLDYHLKLCSAPCENKISEADYRTQIAQVFRLMEGKKQEVLRELEVRMKACSAERRYEEAAVLRDQISGLQQLTVRSRQFLPSKAVEELQDVLKMTLPPARIEGFDISNTFGKQAVGSMVTFVDGKPFKAGYKRFKIQDVQGIDDYACMREVVRRRYDPRRRDSAIDKAKVPYPDLVIIDGGKGHLAAARDVLKILQLDLPIIGIAKEFEQIFLPGRRQPILLPPQSKALQLVQRIRDEAHRFAIGYHRLLRGKHALASVLDDIPGIGPRKKQDLLVCFGSVEAMRSARVEDFTQVRGISPVLAQRIIERLK